MAATAQFSAVSYSPLSKDEFRLVILEQGSGADPIRCRLLHVELGSRDYEALSYEWGVASDNDPEISVDGEQVRARQNLHDGLWHIRCEHEDRYLWIDALCINQSDIREKNYQVQLMGKIFSEASSVIAWLGLAADNSDLAVDTLVQSKAYKTTTETIAIQAIMDRSYWQRMWIVQEVQLAAELTLYCGTKKVSSSALLGLSSPGIDRSPGKVHLSQRTAKARKKLQDWLYWCLYFVNCDFDCTDTKDLVYALLGIASDCQRAELRPDYAKQPVEIFADVLEVFDKCNDEQETEHIRERLIVENELGYRFGLIDGDVYMDMYLRLDCGFP